VQKRDDLNGRRVRIAFPLPQNQDAKGVVGLAWEVGVSAPPSPVYSVQPHGPCPVRLKDRQFQIAELRPLL
jgi:hypothetical protein